MTIEEALNTIEIAIDEVEWCYTLSYAEAFEVAKKALEKQIGKRPKSISISGDIDGIASCARCKTLVTPDMLYCDICGQKIDWRKDND